MTYETYSAFIVISGLCLLFGLLTLMCSNPRPLWMTLIGTGIAVFGVVSIVAPPKPVMFQNSVDYYNRIRPSCLLRDGVPVPMDSLDSRCIVEYIDYRVDSTHAAQRLWEWKMRSFHKAAPQLVPRRKL